MRKQQYGIHHDHTAQDHADITGNVDEVWFDAQTFPGKSDHRNSRNEVRDGKREIDMPERNHELQGKRLRYIHVQRPVADVAGQAVKIVHEQTGINRDHDRIGSGENHHFVRGDPVDFDPQLKYKEDIDQLGEQEYDLHEQAGIEICFVFHVTDQAVLGKNKKHAYMLPNLR